jgi:hypothetical protein
MLARGEDHAYPRCIALVPKPTRYVLIPPHHPERFASLCKQGRSSLQSANGTAAERDNRRFNLDCRLATFGRLQS